MSLKKNRKGIGYRLMFWTTLLVTVSVVSVSGTVYYLLSNSLRESDRLLITKLALGYAHTFKERGAKYLREEISPEVMVVVLDKSGKEVFQQMPIYLDNDFEDEEELAQIRRDTSKLPLSKGWNTILLLSGEEDRDLFHKLEFSLRKKALEHEWESILPLIDNDNVEVFTMPIDRDYWIRVGRSSEEREEHLSKIRSISLMVLVPFILLGFILSFFLSRGILSPLKNLVSTMGKIKSGDRKARASIRGAGDEIDLLAEEFNLLLDNNEKLIENLKSSIDNVAHDLRTPLTRFRMSAEEAINKDDKDFYREALLEGMENSEDILSLLNAIMDVSEAETKTMNLRRENFNLRLLLEDLVEMYSYVAEDKKIMIELDLEEDLLIAGDRTRLTQAFGNLLDNAIKFSPPQSQILITASATEEIIMIEIQDQGPGISQEDISRIWDRLYRGDKSRSTPGLGIGLSVVRAIIEAHNGTITVSSTLNAGATFTVTLPTCNVEVRRT